MARFVIVVLLFAGVVYMLLWALERRRALGGGRTGAKGLGPGRPRPRPRQVAPDDDEDFLRWLERKQRKDRKKDPDGPE